MQGWMLKLNKKIICYDLMEINYLNDRQLKKAIRTIC